MGAISHLRNRLIFQACVVQVADPFISLCIATLGDAAAVEALQQSLVRLRTSVQWELVLVFNGRNKPETGADQWRPLPCTVTVLYEPLPGKSRALNLALQKARGEIVVYTDDDVAPSSDWLEHIARAARDNPDVNVFGGRILPSGDVPAWVMLSSNLHTGMLSQHDFGKADLIYPSGAYPIGPNMAVRRAAVSRRRARWNEAMGPGTRLPVGDESDFLAQLSPPDATDRLYIADAVVYHTVDGRYFPLRRALLRNFQIGLAAGRLSVQYPSKLPVRALLTDARNRAFRRIKELRSLMELICIAVKAIGVAQGTLEQKLISSLKRTD